MRTKRTGRPAISPGFPWRARHGRAIRAAREALELSQAAVGKRAKLKQSAVSDYETARRAPARSSLSRLLRALKLEEKDLKP